MYYKNIFRLILILSISTGVGSGCFGGAASSSTAATLVLTPSATTVITGGAITLSTTGGVSPYTYALSGEGSLSGNTYTAGSTSGQNITITVTDTSGSTAQVSILVQNTVTLTLSSTTISAGGTITLAAAGGVAPYTYSVSSGGGTLTGSSFLAPISGASVVLQATDSAGVTGTATLTIQSSSAVSITPSSITLYVGDVFTFKANGGSGGYIFSLTGGGIISNGTFTAPSGATSSQVEVTDSSGGTAVANITVVNKNTLYTTTTFQLNNSALLVFDMPTTTALLPTFALGGASSAGDFGQNVNETNQLSAFAPVPASAALALSNFNWQDSYPYTGTLLISGSGGSDTFGFCIQLGDQVGHLQTIQTSQTLSYDFKAITFSSFISQMSGGINLQGLWISQLNSINSVGSATMQIQNGLYNHEITNCGNYQSYALISSSSQ